MANETTRKDPMRGFRWKVQIGSDTIGFRKVSGLSAEIDSVEYREGQDPPYKEKSDGLISYSDVTMEKGFAVDCLDVNVLYKWYNKIKPYIGEPPAEYKKTIVITLLHPRTGAEKVKWTLYDAWIKKYAPGDLDAEASDVVAQSVDIVYDGFVQEKVEPKA